jgi:hypothetical protein
MIPRKYDNYLAYKFVLGFYTSTIELYINKKESVNIVDLTKQILKVVSKLK